MQQLTARPLEKLQLAAYSLQSRRCPDYSILWDRYAPRTLRSRQIESVVCMLRCMQALHKLVQVLRDLSAVRCVPEEEHLQCC